MGYHKLLVLFNDIVARLAFDFDGRLYAFEAVSVEPFVEKRELDVSQFQVIRFPDNIYSNQIQICPVLPWTSGLPPLIYLDRDDSYCFDNSSPDITVYIF